MLTRHIFSQSNRKCVRSIHEDISLQDTIGKGKFGVVRLGRYLKSGKMCAVKVINKRKVGNELLQDELVVLRRIKDTVHCDDIVRILDIYEDCYLVYVVMEYMGGGDLRNRVIQFNRFSGQCFSCSLMCRM